MFPLAPGIAAGTALGISDVLAKMVLATGCDVLTMLSFRSVVGLAFIAIWLRFGSSRKPTPACARSRWASASFSPALCFACSRRSRRSTYQRPCYLLHLSVADRARGFAARARTLRWKGILCALRRVLRPRADDRRASGRPGFRRRRVCARRGVLPDRDIAGHPRLPVGADARLTTWYSMISSTAMFIAVSLLTRTWNPPQSDRRLGLLWSS